MSGPSTAAILAGGRGTRLGGANKALLEVDGRRIVDRQLAVLRPLFAEILVVGGDPGLWRPFGVRVEADRFAARGAPGGVHAALEASQTAWVFCLGCDMPFVSAPVIERLWRARGAGDEVVVPVRQGHPEPLFAFWRRSVRERFAQALRTGSPSLRRLLDACRTRRVPESVIAEIDPTLRALENVNTPEDLDRVRR